MDAVFPLVGASTKRSRAQADVLAQDAVPLAFAAGHGQRLPWFDASPR